MRATRFLVLVLSIFFVSFTMPEKKFPSSELKDLSGRTVSTDDFIGKNQYTVVSFWATWCTPCLRELDIYMENYEDWKEEFDVNIVAISIDNARQLAKVRPLAAQKQWEFTILSDANQDLMKLLSFSFVPQTFILDQDGNIVFDHSGFKPGDELEMEKIFRGEKK